MTTKTRTSIWSSQTLTASSADTTSSWIDLSSADDVTLDFSLVNGGTGPTIAAQIQIQVANNYNAGSPTLITNYGGAFVGSTTNGATSSWGGIVIPRGTQAVRLVGGSNTGQNVTANADISVVT